MNVIKIYGPPGTGKTEQLLSLLQEELKTIAPARIAFLTFTRAAWEEAQQRMSSNISGPNDLPLVRTIHSLCFRQLGLSRQQVVTGPVLRSFGKNLNIELGGLPDNPWIEEAHGKSEESDRPGDCMLQLDHFGRHRCLSSTEALQFASGQLDMMFYDWFIKAYRDWRERERLLDYTDFLEEYLRRGPELEADVMFVDEAQDLSLLQWQVVWKMAQNCKRLYLAGDDDQAIYSWAGASASHLNQLPGEVIVLPQSYRLPRRILRTALLITNRIQKRQSKEFSARDEDGEVQRASNLGQTLLRGRTFILFRNHYRGDELRNQLLRGGVPFRGQRSPLERDDVRKAVETDTAFPELPSTLARYCQLARDRHPKRRLLNPSVELLSIHQSKGREADTVVLDLTMTPRTRATVGEDDEHRVWYVGVTRAKKRLYLLSSGNNTGYPL